MIMSAEVLKEPYPYRPVIQFSIHADNKVGRLNEIISLLSVHQVHVMAISILDTTDSSIIRLIVDYPRPAKPPRRTQFLVRPKWTDRRGDRRRIYLTVTSALVQAEINIHYTYPFLVRPMVVMPSPSV